MIRRLLLGATVVALLARPAAACSSCGCGDTTLTAMGLEKPYRNRVRLALEERFSGHTAGDAAWGGRSYTLRSSVALAWSPAAWFTVGALVPLVAEWVGGGGAPLRNVTGLGDAEVSVRAAVYRDRAFSPRHILSLLVGLKTPTGPRRYDSAGYPLADDDQLGTGSWDPFFGATWAWYGDNKLSTYASASYRLTTPGYRGYRHGQSVGGSVGAQYQPWQRVAIGLSADAVWLAADEAQASTPMPTTRPNTGGVMLALSPSLIVAPLERWPSWTIKLAAQLHVVDWLSGVQREYDAVTVSTIVDVN